MSLPEPSDESRRLGIGPLPAEGFCEHVADCARCQAFLEHLSDDPEWRRRAPAVWPGSSSLPAEPALAGMLEQLHSSPSFDTRGSTTTAKLPDGALGFLAPPELPGDLGKLGSYRVLAELGRGGMGIVLLAHDPQLERTVAIKVLPKERADEKSRSRFVREARAAAGLNHDHMVPVYAVANPTDGPPYLVMQYVKGPTLRQRIQTEGRLNPHEAARIAAQVADGLAAAHRAGLVHRDIKPANIMLEDATGRAKIMDFGLARVTSLAGGISQEGMISGTPEYMSPEQVRQPERIDARSDVYSLGVTLYEALTGELPFRGLPHMVLQQVLDEEPCPLRRLNDKIPRDLETICLRCLQKEPGQRYASAEALADDLRRFQAGQPIHARPISPWERAVKWARRRPAIAALVALVATVTCVGFAVVTWQWQQAEQARQAAEAHARAEALAKEKLERSLYFSLVGQAGRELSAHKVGRAEELLDQCPQHLRGWEWHYLKRQRYGSLPPLEPAGAVWGIAFSPDSRYLASGTLDTVYVWDLSTRKHLRTLEGHKKRVHRLAYSPDGRRLVTADEEGSIIVWDATTFQKIHTLPGHPRATGTTGIRGVRSVAFSPDSRHLASGGADHKVRLWDLMTGREIRALTGHTEPVQGVVFTADGQYLTSASWDGTVKVWDDTGQETRSFRAPIQFVVSVACSPDGRHLAVGSNEGTVKVVDLTTGEEALGLHGHTNAVYGLAFSPDGRRLFSAGASDCTIRVWDATTGHEALSLYGHSALITSVAFSPDGCLASAGFDRTIRLWDATPLSDTEASRQFLTLQGHSHLVYRVAFSPDSRRLASASQDGTVRVWDATSGKQTAVFREHDALVMDVAFSPDSQRLASASWDATVKVWDVGSLRVIHTLPGKAGFARCVAFSPDGQYLASGHHDGTVIIWNPGTGKEIRRFKEQSVLTTVAFSPDSRRLASASGGDWTVKIWDTATWKELGTLKYTGPITGLAFSPDNRLLATCSHDGTVTIWDTTTWQEKRTLRVLEGDSKQLRDVVFSPDGKRLACGSWDQSVTLWDLAGSRAEPRSLAGHAGAVLTVSWSPDGKRFASGSGYPGKGEIKIWDASLWEKELVIGP